MQEKSPKGSWNFEAAVATEEMLSKCLETMPDLTSLAVMKRNGDLLAVTGPSRKSLLKNSTFALGMFGMSNDEDEHQIEFNVSRTPAGDLLAGSIDGEHVVVCLTRPSADVDRALSDLEWLAERVLAIFENF